MLGVYHGKRPLLQCCRHLTTCVCLRLMPRQTSSVDNTLTAWSMFAVRRKTFIAACMRSCVRTRAERGCAQHSSWLWHFKASGMHCTGAGGLPWIAQPGRDACGNACHERLHTGAWECLGYPTLRCRSELCKAPCIPTSLQLNRRHAQHAPDNKELSFVTLQLQSPVVSMCTCAKAVVCAMAAGGSPAGGSWVSRTP